MITKRDAKKYRSATDYTAWIAPYSTIRLAADTEHAGNAPKLGT